MNYKQLLQALNRGHIKLISTVTFGDGTLIKHYKDVDSGAQYRVKHELIQGHVNITVQDVSADTGSHEFKQFVTYALNEQHKYSNKEALKARIIELREMKLRGEYYTALAQCELYALKNIK